MFTTIITFIIVLSVLVFVHEYGHFWAARRFGAKVKEFGFGFPPRIGGVYKDKDGKWQKIKGAGEPEEGAGTIYSLNWVPIGGFVSIKGEDGGGSDEEDSFAAKRIWQRAVILLAGVTMNVVLAAVLISVGYMIGLPQALDSVGPGAHVTNRRIQITQVLEDSPASRAGIEINDVILSINGREFLSESRLQEFVAGNEGNVLQYRIQRGVDELEFEVAPAMFGEMDNPGIGVGIAETGLVRYTPWRAVVNGVVTTALMTWFIAAAFFDLIAGLVTGQGLSIDLGGPVRIAEITGDAARMGIVYLLNFTALFSINLAILNALPFPALDGGRILFLIIEKIKGSPVRKEVEGMVHYVGFALLMVLVVLVTYKDILRVISN